MTFDRATYFLRLARSCWRACGGGRYVPTMISPRLLHRHCLLVWMDDYVEGRAN